MPEYDQSLPADEKEKTPALSETVRGGQIPRRTFIKGLLGLSVTANTVLAGGYTTEREFGFLSKLAQPDFEDIPREIPPQLQEKEIPYANEHFREPCVVLKDAFDKFVQAGGTPFYKRPSYYLNTSDAIRDVIESGSILEPDTDAKQYRDMLNFTRTTFTSVGQLHEFDPGTGAKKILDTSLQNVDYFQQSAIIAQEYGKQFIEAKNAIDAMRGSERVSTSALMQYFLRKSNGDIVQSLWDTTLFLKLAARADITKLTNPHVFEQEGDDIYLGDRSGAELIASMFYDDFSSEIPLEKLLTIVSPDDAQLNTDDPMANTLWKDFMPVNRDGTPYHVYNIAAMSAVMDASLAEEMVTLHYTNSRDGSPTAEHGRIKIGADLLAARQTRDMRNLFEKYKID